MRTSISNMGFSIRTTLATFGLLAAAATPVHAQTPVNFGDIITSPGVYYLNGNQSGASAGVIIRADDVTLHLFNFTLSGDGGNVGVSSLGYDRTKVVGGRITNFAHGIDFSDNRECSVNGTRIDHCTDSGVDWENVQTSSLLRVRSEFNGHHGVQLRGGAGNKLLTVLANNNRGDGIHFNEPSEIGVRNSKIRQCWSAYNWGDGIRLLDSGYNELIQNQAVWNRGTGIYLGTASLEPPLLGASSSDDNEIARNFVVFNHAGIVVDSLSRLNRIHDNTALANELVDLADGNPEPPCLNTWFMNQFITRAGSGRLCIF